MRKKLTIAERLAARVKTDPETGCILWRGNKDGAYAALVVDGRQRAAHRLAWEVKHGPIPKGLHVCHKCDRPACVNVEHLFLGTDKDNVQDMIRKGRDVRARIGPRDEQRVRLFVRVTESEKARWLACAKADGFELSVWARRVLTARAVRRAPKGME